MRKPAKRAKSKILTPRRIREVQPRQYKDVFKDPPFSSPPPPTAAETLTTRQSTHGDFSENARVMQGVKRELRSAGNWNLGMLQDIRQLRPNLSDVQAEAIEMIVVKLGRIVTGDPNNPDHYLDIEGYARLARERLTS